MKTICLLSLSLLCCYSMLAQPNEALLVIGPEASLDFHNIGESYGRPPFSSLGIVVERPMGKFSLATGFVRKNYGTIRYKSFSGERHTEIVKEQKVTYYHYLDRRAELRYYSVPLRLQYRLPCNCVYVQAGLDVDFRIDKGIASQANATPRAELVERSNVQRLKSTNLGAELALGVKLHESKQLRIFMRPAIYWMLDPARHVNAQKEQIYKRLKLTLGVQYALLHPDTSKKFQSAEE